MGMLLFENRFCKNCLMGWLCVLRWMGCRFLGSGVVDRGRVEVSSSKVVVVILRVEVMW